METDRNIEEVLTLADQEIDLIESKLAHEGGVTTLEEVPSWGRFVSQYTFFKKTKDKSRMRDAWTNCKAELSQKLPQAQEAIAHLENTLNMI